MTEAVRHNIAPSYSSPFFNRPNALRIHGRLENGDAIRAAEKAHGSGGSIILALAATLITAVTVSVPVAILVGLGIYFVFEILSSPDYPSPHRYPHHGYGYPQQSGTTVVLPRDGSHPRYVPSRAPEPSYFPWFGGSTSTPSHSPDTATFGSRRVGHVPPSTSGHTAPPTSFPWFGGSSSAPSHSPDTATFGSRRVGHMPPSTSGHTAPPTSFSWFGGSSSTPPHASHHPSGSGDGTATFGSRRVRRSDEP